MVGARAAERQWTEGCGGGEGEDTSIRCHRSKSGLTHRCHHLAVLHGSCPFPNLSHGVSPKSWSSPSAVPQAGALEGTAWVVLSWGWTAVPTPHHYLPPPWEDNGEPCVGLRIWPSSPATPLPSRSAQDEAPSLAPWALSNLGARTEPRADHVSHLLVCFKNMYLIYTRSLVRSARLVQTTAGIGRLSFPPPRPLFPFCWSLCSSRKNESHPKS